MRDPVQGREVLRALYDGCEGLIEVRALPQKVSGFYAVEDVVGVTAFLKAHYADNLYWGVGTRRDATSGALGNCLHLGAVFVDLDDKQHPTSDLLERRRTFPFGPSTKIVSGGGEHWYWFLREPLSLGLADEVTLAYDVLRRLAGYLGGDLVVAEPARILRVPSTVNHKYDPPRTVTVTAFAPDRRYNVSEFLEWLPPVAIPSARGAAVDLAQPVRHERNTTLYRLGRGLKSKGLPPSVLAETLSVVNQRCCEPPLEGRELQEIVEHVIHQPDRFERSARQRVEVVADVH
jgi:hypothetical protein